jgi:hypothetical protein
MSKRNIIIGAGAILVAVLWYRMRRSPRKKSPLRRDGSFRRVLWQFLKQLGFAKGFLARDPDGHAVHLIERYFTQQHTPPVGGIKNPQPLATE